MTTSNRNAEKTKTLDRAPSSLFKMYIGLITVYLLAEIAFNISLLDVAGGGGSSEEVDRIEVIGRTLSSFGIGLVICRFLFKRQLKKKGSYGEVNYALLGMFLLAMTYAFYHLQNMAIEMYSESRSAQDRSDAYLLMAVKKGIANNAISIDGMEFLNNNLDSTETKTVLTLFGPLVYSSTEFRQRLHRNRNAYITTIAEREHEKFVRSAYNAYVELSNSRGKLADLYVEVDRTIRTEARNKASEMYDSVISGVNRSNVRVNRQGYANQRVYNQIDQNIRSATGLSGPGRFNLRDRNDFINKMLPQMVTPDKIREAMNRELRKEGSQFIFDRNLRSEDNVKPNQSRQQFLQSPFLNIHLYYHLTKISPSMEMFLYRGVSGGLDKLFSATHYGALIRLDAEGLVPWGLQFNDFSRLTRGNLVYNTLDSMNARLKNIQESSSTRTGSQYVKALWIPAIALSLSLMMIFVNAMSMIATIVTYMFSGNHHIASKLAVHFIKLSVIGVFVLLAVTAPYAANSEVTESKPYKALIERTSQIQPHAAWLIDWTVRTQPILERYARPIQRMTGWSE